MSTGIYKQYLGNIAGYLYISSGYNAYAKNCVNYGSVKCSGTIDNWIYLGRIVGYSERSSSSCKYVQKCLDYGTITHNNKHHQVLLISWTVGYGIHLTYTLNCVYWEDIYANDVNVS